MSLDRKVGFVLDLLERDGLSENTAVVFMGDHGRAMVRGKQWPYESGLHVPELVIEIDVTSASIVQRRVPIS